MSLVDEFIKDIENDIEDLAGVTLKSYAREATEKLAEEWANELIDVFTKGEIDPDISDETKEKRKDRKESILGHDKPLLETGTLLSSIVFILYVDENKYYSTLQVGVEDNSTPHGHGKNKLTPMALMYIHEYGLHKNDVQIPARPVLTESAEKMGAEVDRIYTRTLAGNIHQYMLGYEQRAKHLKVNTPLGYYTKSVTRKKPSRSYTKTGRIHQRGTSFYFEWDE